MNLNSVKSWKFSGELCDFRLRDNLSNLIASGNQRFRSALMVQFNNVDGFVVVKELRNYSSKI